MSDTNPQHVLIRNIQRELDENIQSTVGRACKVANVPVEAVLEHHIVKQSIDARGTRAPRFILQIELTLPPDIKVAEQPGGRVEIARSIATSPEGHPLPPERSPIIIGMGPCGLFAALHLASRGIKPIVIERGKAVKPRAKDVAALMGRGEINENSNLCFGEGGAGTWSDGKLYTRVGGPWIRPILKTFVEMGGPSRILVDGRPHLGTDKLVRILQNIRAQLLSLGCDIRFETTVESLHINDEQLQGVKLTDGSIIESNRVILAPGHSARDLYETLVQQDVAIEPKPFALGFRVEHPQRLINDIQYGQWSEHEELPAAYYELAHQTQHDDLDAFSFCMCPGGSVVPTPTRHGEICVNGMSHAARSGKYANSALVASVAPEDFPRLLSTKDRAHAYDDNDPLLGMRAQQAIEQSAWTMGGGKFQAPASTIIDFLADRSGDNVRRTTYKPGITDANVNELYPTFITRALRSAIREFDRQMRGFITEDAVLLGVETRTSAPIQILRDTDTLQSRSHGGLYPGGEGCGYGGGIMSAAIDGIRIADRIIDELMG